MSTQQPTRRVPTLARSIDSVLESPPTSAPVRPLAKLRPSWIGPVPPERPATPGIQAMKQTITVEYSAPGLQPPVYICTSLSEPQWDPIEMHRDLDDQGPRVFSKAFQVEDGEYQYKFRLGEGDWWVCDESKPTVDDGHGNKNNLLVVKPREILNLPSQKKTQTDSGSSTVASGGSQPKMQGPPVVPLPQSSLPPPSILTTSHQEPSGAMSAGTQVPHPSPDSSAAEQTPEKEVTNPFDVDEEEPDDTHTQLLLAHESLATQGTDYDNTVDKDDDSSSTSSSSSDEDEGEDVEAPLLRHESMEPCRGTSPSASPPADEFAKPASNFQGPKAADPEDLTLDPFPKDREGILKLILQTHQRLPADQTSDEHLYGTPLSHDPHVSPTIMHSLPSIGEADEEALETLRRVELEEFEKEEASGEELDPLRLNVPMAAEVVGREPEDADFEPKVESPQKIQVEEHIVIQVVGERQSLAATVLDKIGGTGSALAMAVGLLVIAAGICTMQFL